MEKIIQVGVTATRAPDGTFDESTPIYRKVPQVNEGSNLTQVQEDSMHDLIQSLCERYKQKLKEAMNDEI